MISWLAEFGLEPVDAAAMVIGLGVMALLVLIWRGLIDPDTSKQRLAMVSQRRDELRAEMLAAKKRQKKSDTAEGLKKLVTWLRLARGSKADAYALKLAQAGWRSRDAIWYYLVARLAVPLLVCGGTLLLFYGLDIIQLKPLAKHSIAGLLMILGLIGVDTYVRNAAEKRLDAIRLALPDGFDLFVICAEAGLSLDSSFDRVSREIGEACPELADELSLTSVELNFLSSRQKALQNLADRVPLAGIKALVSTLQQTEKYGTPLARALRVLAAELRDERMMRAEEKAARLPAVLTVPMILFILPPLFIVLIGPAILRTMDAMAGMR